MLSRLRGAWQVLLGERLVPFQIQSEWALYQQTFQGQLEALSSYLARQAKAEKKRLERIEQDLASEPAAEEPMDRDARKQALWKKRAATMPHIGPPMPQGPHERSTQSS